MKILGRIRASSKWEKTRSHKEKKKKKRRGITWGFGRRKRALVQKTNGGGEKAIQAFKKQTKERTPREPEKRRKDFDYRTKIAR